MMLFAVCVCVCVCVCVFQQKHDIWTSGQTGIGFQNSFAGGSQDNDLVSVIEFLPWYVPF